MKIFLNKTQEIERHLQKPASQEENLLFEAKLLLDRDLFETRKWQKQTYALVKEYSRHQLKAEIEAVHQQLFTQPEHAGFRKRIRLLFSPG